MADAFARWIEALLGRHGLVVFESSDPAAKPLVAEVFARELQTPGRTAALAAAAGERSRRRSRAAGRAAARQRLALPPRWRPPADPSTGRRVRCRATTIPLASLVRGSAQRARALQPERAAPADRPGHALSDDLLRRRAERARVPRPARGVYEHFGVPMPLMYPRATATLIDSATARFLSTSQRPARRSAAAGRIGAQSAARIAAAAAGRTGDARGGRSDPAKHAAGGRGDAGGRSDARRRGEDDARQDGARSARRCTAR